MRAACVLLVCLSCGVPCRVAANIADTPEGVVLDGDTYRIVFDKTNGAILRIRQDGVDTPLLRSGEHGLWRLVFEGNQALSAAEFSAEAAERRFAYSVSPGDEALEMVYEAPQASVIVTATAAEKWIDLRAEVTPHRGTLLSLDLPARLRFSPETTDRLVFPANGNSSVGTAFRGAFFAPQPTEQPTGWTSGPAGSAGYEALLGGALDQRPDADEPVALRVTEEGRQWLGDRVIHAVEGARALVNRPSTREQTDVVLVDSPNGPYFAGSRLGGEGALWRLGGRVGDTETGTALRLVEATVRHLVTSSGGGRTRIGLIALANGPEKGSWGNVTVADWRRRLGALESGLDPAVELSELDSPRAVLDALADDEYLAILNPYGEWAPVLQEGGMPQTVAAVGAYVRGGGNWFEVGGYPFYYEMLPLRFLTHSTTYPPGFADFIHLDTLPEQTGAAGHCSVYGIRPQMPAPWAGARDRASIFVPGRLECGGDEAGGYCVHAFATYVEAGAQWSAPAARIHVGSQAPQSIATYCHANGIDRRLEEKMAPEVYSRFRDSVLVYYAGNCAEKIANLHRLPVPSQVHFADYLKGGFDKQYPDHLPVRPDFGTPEQFRELFDRAHELGHLVVPYTNPTWWCDHPRGPTFEAEGEAPLLRLLDGGLSYERYGNNDGYTVCHWHPAVQAANRETVRQFTEEYPVDVLFQDQCGARGWRYDKNPASPTVYAYIDGLLSMVAEDSLLKPLSTESGWDRVAQYEAQLCGMSWAIVPTESGPEWRTLMRNEYPPNTWEVFPLAQYVAHDKAAMIHHDLGQFVTNREVLAWTLGLGFCMSYRTAATALDNQANLSWLRWLDRIQKSVCARYVGRPLTGLAHERGEPTEDDDGLLHAQYEDLRITANLGPTARHVEGYELAPYGFVARAPELLAGSLSSVGDHRYGETGIDFVCETDEGMTEVYVYAPEQSVATIELPAVGDGPVLVQFDGAPPLPAQVRDRRLELRLPGAEDPRAVAPPPDLADTAPADRPGDRPAVGVLDFGAGVEPSWTTISPQQWLDALSTSALVTRHGLRVVKLDTVAKVTDALGAGPRHWLCIINPYGEGYPAPGPGRWRETLDAIIRYVNNGGSWWETGGYTFYRSIYPREGGWDGDSSGPQGMASVGLAVGPGEVDEPLQPLTVTPTGEEWLSAEVAQVVGTGRCMVNRGLPRQPGAYTHTALVAGETADYIGGYRLDGWGWLWRIGGFYPDPAVVLPVVTDVTEYLYTHPPLPAEGRGVPRLFHAVVRGR